MKWGKQLDGENKHLSGPFGYYVKNTWFKMNDVIIIEGTPNIDIS